jgi:hypothetical protein
VDTGSRQENASNQESGLFATIVIAGLDRAIHLFLKRPLKSATDMRVKPAYDGRA